MSTPQVASRSRRYWAFAIDQTILLVGALIIFAVVIAANMSQLQHLYEIIAADPVWTPSNGQSSSEVSAQIKTLFQSEPVAAATRNLAHPFALANLLTLVLSALYYIIPTAKWGRTPGKHFLSITVHSVTNNKTPDWEQSSIRYFSFLGAGTFGGIVVLLDLFVNYAFTPSNQFVDVLEILLSQIVYILTIVSVVMIIARPDRRGLHDLFAKTIVYYTPKPKKD